jgi:hypothetical protein
LERGLKGGLRRIEKKSKRRPRKGLQKKPRGAQEGYKQKREIKTESNNGGHKESPRGPRKGPQKEPQERAPGKALIRTEPSPGGGAMRGSQRQPRKGA